MEKEEEDEERDVSVERTVVMSGLILSSSSTRE
jgi:hypothetical protein